MDTTAWERATERTAEVDRRESRLVLRAAIAVGLLVVLVIVGNQLGITRPTLSFSGSSAGSMMPDTQQATLSLDVRNRGLFAERVTDLSFDYPGLAIESAQFRPAPLGSFDEGFLDVSMRVDCSAEQDGHPLWRDGPALEAQAPVRITTQRPWGSATETYSGTGLGPDLAWQLLQTASGACES